MWTKQERFYRTGPTIADQTKINSLLGQLQRAKARKDRHLVRQLEDQLRRLNRY